jgi:hypothetical protein
MLPVLRSTRLPDLRWGEPGIEADRPAQGELTVLHPAAASHHHVRILEQAELLLLPCYLKHNSNPSHFGTDPDPDLGSVPLTNGWDADPYQNLQ